MDPFVQLGVAAITAVGAVWGSYLAAKAGVRAELAVMAEQLRTLQAEVKGLREWRHHTEGLVTKLQAEVMRRR